MAKAVMNGNKTGKGFDKNPQNINKSGKNKKVFTTLTDYIEKTYGKRPPKNEVIALMEYIECLPVTKLKEFVQDSSIPAVIAAYGRLLLTGEQKDLRRVHGAEMLNDRLHGKPKQSMDLTTKDKEINNLSGLTYEQLYELTYGKKPDKV